MILTFLIENSKIFAGCAEAESNRIIFEDTLSADLRKTPAEYAIILKELLELHGINRQKIRGGIISSCVPQLSETIRSAATSLFHKEFLEVGPGMKTGVNIRIDDPGELGADLLVAAAAGIKEYGAPLVIINLGTATTISVIDKDRSFRGGLIAPGIRLSLESLSSHTAFLPEVAVRKPGKLIGTTSAESMQSGVITGSAAMIDGLVDRIREEMEQEVELVATGEYAGLVVPGCRHMIQMDVHLMMKGLMLLYHRNKR